ncbi:MMPL family transporter [Bacillus sp. AGMB 02131]|uniref:MMPL family transporter n=1 Tax=Peribacillus faecalis TaxID=2772559 RepID=A0A927CVC0_9BACI|nr:MMPL family transporter [Peribacillus faecalis]MBD3107756.1 MMPL family transporter [Peribacillus faecalis]
MKRVMNWRIASFVIWLIISAVMIIAMPNLDQLVREKGQISIPDTEQSEMAKDLLHKMDGEDSKSYSIIAVFNSGNDKKLTDEQLVLIENKIDQLKDQQSGLGIKSILTHLDNEELKGQLVSEDGTTILTQIEVDSSQGEITEVAEELYSYVEISDIDSYLTGTDLVIEDFVQSTQDGIKKTEIIAIVFILVVLILVFRSPVVPLVSLLLVGISYIVSMGIVTQLVDHFNYPFSNFTQVFLVVILFGIGTDYNILLFTRFKEELGKSDNILDAIKITYKTAGKTVLYSGLAVFIGFMALILADFQLYRSSSAVAVGVAVLIAVLMTVNPFFMALLGKKLFWPSKKFEGHANNKTWALLSKVSVFRPFLAIIFVVIISIPFIYKYSNVLSYDDLIEVNDGYASKQGVNVIGEHFSSGFSAPLTFVLKAEDALDNEKSLQVIDQLTETIAEHEGVAKVFSATRPANDKIDDLYVRSQSDTLNSGLGEAKDGVNQINDGLTDAEQQLNQQDEDGVESVQTLIDGTAEVKSGVDTLANALDQLAVGLVSGVSGAEEIENGLAAVNSNMTELTSAMSQLQQGYVELEKGMSSFSSFFKNVSQAIDGASQAFSAIESALANAIKTSPELGNNKDIQTSIAVAKTGKQQMNVLSQKLIELTPQYESAIISFQKANSAFDQANNGLSQLQTGVSQLQAGSTELADGLQEAAAGSTQIADKTPALSNGLTAINDGQKQLYSGLTELSAKMKELQSGLSETTDGLTEISDGLTNAQSYLSGLSESKSAEQLHIPEDVLTGEDFQKALDMYMSEDRTITSMRIILDVNPYSKEAMAVVKDLKEDIASAMDVNYLNGAQYALGGETSQNIDLEELASGDFIRTATIMLIGIGIVLIFITRSLLKSLFIIGSLVLAYYTSVGMSEWFSTSVLGVNELGWNVPFFSFIMIIALGVDYSIFLMMRYNELEGNSTKAIVEAAGNIGGVVISAAIILGGTFAALIPSGVLTLIEIAITVIIGLLLLSFVMLPILLPALLGVVDRIKRFSQTQKKKQD